MPPSQCTPERLKMGGEQYEEMLRPCHRDGKGVMRRNAYFPTAWDCYNGECEARARGTCSNGAALGK
jgi:hypothetical protein